MMHILKNIQFWTNKNYIQIRQWLVIGIVGILLIFSMVSIAKQNNLIAKVGVLSTQNKRLSEDNKTLNKTGAESSRRIETVVLQSREYDRCIAELIAKNSRDHVGITIKSLDTCTVSSQNGIENFLPQPGAFPGTQTQKAAPATPKAASPSPSTPSTPSTPSGSGSGSSSTPTPTPAPTPVMTNPLINLPLPCINLGIIKAC